MELDDREAYTLDNTLELDVGVILLEELVPYKIGEAAPDDEGPLEVLEGVLRLYLEVVLVLVVLDRKTPLLYVMDVVVLLFLKHDAGMVKQHGMVLVDVLVGSNTPE